MKQAIRNINNGISLLQAADTASNQIEKILERMRELSLQSMNDANNKNDRNYLNLEFRSLDKQIKQIVEYTQWNGSNVARLRAPFYDPLNLQIGPNSGQKISLDYPIYNFLMNNVSDIPSFHSVDPTKSFITYSNGSGIISPSVIDASQKFILSSISVEAGDEISIGTQGSFQTNPGSSQLAVGVFLDSAGQPVSLSDYSTTPTWPGDWPATPPLFTISMDPRYTSFFDPSVQVFVPQGAVSLALMAKDTFNGDNTDPSGTFGVLIWAYPSPEITTRETSQSALTNIENAIDFVTTTRALTGATIEKLEFSIDFLSNTKGSPT